MEKNIYGYVNGEAVFSANEFVYKSRGFGALETDEEIFNYAQKVTYNWSTGTYKADFRTFYLSDYALSEPRRSLTADEFKRLQAMQDSVRREHDKAEEARQWQKVDTLYWADNSVEEIWRDKYGTEKRVTVIGAHGDAC